MSEPDPNRQKRAGSTSQFRVVVVPYLIAIASQLPLTLIYLLNLWRTRDHFGLLPVALLAFGFLLYRRWPRQRESMFYGSVRGDVFFVLGIALGWTGAVLVSPWCSFAALSAFVVSLLFRTADAGMEVGRLTSVSVPLLVLLILPLGFDFENVQGDLLMLESAKTLAAGVSSDILDMLFLVHFQAGTVVELPGYTVDATAIGNGVFSLFSLLILTAVFIALMRRPFFRGLLLLISAWLWGFLFTAFGMVLLVLGYEYFQADWYAGTSRTVLETLLLAAAALFIVITDQLLIFLFGPVDITSIDESAPYQVRISRFWNRYISGKRQTVIDPNDQTDLALLARRNRPVTRAAASTLWVGCLIVAVSALLQVVDVGRAMALANRGASAVNLLAPESDSGRLLPAQVGAWNQIQYDELVPQFESCLSATAYRWTFGQPDGTMQIVLELRHPFPAVSYPLRNFVNRGWIVVDDQRLIQQPADEAAPRWEFESADLYNSMSETCHVAMCHLDQFGMPLDIPSTWNSRFLPRCIDRLGNRVKPRLLRPETIEITAYAVKIGILTESEKQQVRQLFLASREMLRQQFQSGQLSSWAAQSPVRLSSRINGNAD